MITSLRSWLKLGDTPVPEQAPLRELIEALDRLDPGRARHLARVAYLLGRVGHADHHISAEETQTMERLLIEEGELSAEQAMLVVSLAKTSNLLFGGTANFAVAQEFSETATYEEKLALARCLFAVASSDNNISMAEESEIHRITNQLRIRHQDLTALRVQHRRALPGLIPPEPGKP